jgi:hypothetical protein
MIYFFIFIISFAFSCSQVEDGSKESQSEARVKKIKLGEAKTIGILNKINGGASFKTLKSFSSSEESKLPVIGFDSSGQKMDVSIIVEGLEVDSLAIKKIAEINSLFGFANIGGVNYLFSRGNGDTLIFDDFIINSVPLLDFYDKNEAPFHFYDGYYYYIDSWRSFARVKIEGGVFKDKETFLHEKDNIEFSPTLNRKGIYSTVNRFYINSNGLVMLRTDNPSEYQVFDLNGILNNGEKLKLFSTSSNFFLREDNSILKKGNDWEELRINQDGIESINIERTRSFRIPEFWSYFKIVGGYCESISSRSNENGIFCYATKKEFEARTGGRIAGELEVGDDYGRGAILFTENSLISHIPLNDGFFWNNNGACEYHSNCGTVEGNNKTFFGFYNLDSVDFWGDYFVACGEQWEEYTRELLGKRCIIYNIYSQVLTSELNEIVDNNTFTVDHVIFEDDGDILFYGSDFGSTEKKFKLSTHNAGTWSALQDTTVDFDQYIDKILRF